VNNPSAGRDSSARESAHLRTIGIVVLIVGILGAGIFYVVETRSATPAMNELMPGYARQEARQVGMLMGTFGVLMLEWRDALERPGTEAVLIAAASALVALACFRAAGGLDSDNSH
jgi:hypothetical protein